MPARCTPAASSFTFNHLLSPISLACPLIHILKLLLLRCIARSLFASPHSIPIFHYSFSLLFPMLMATMATAVLLIPPSPFVFSFVHFSYTLRMLILYFAQTQKLAFVHLTTNSSSAAERERVRESEGVSEHVGKVDSVVVRNETVSETRCMSLSSCLDIVLVHKLASRRTV